MKINYKEIPPTVRIGGANIEIRQVERCSSNNLGECCIAGSYIEIAEKFDKCDQQSQDSKRNTFYHELTHAILDTMGETTLSRNEKFVCGFSSFLCEAMTHARFQVMEEDNQE